jgi:hypothetical protein
VGKRFDAAGVKRQRDVAALTVVFDPFDEKFQDTGLLSRRERFPHLVELGQGLRYLSFFHELAAKRDELVVDFRQSALGNADALVYALTTTDCTPRE